MTDRSARVRAPELRGAGGWLNTGGREPRLADLRGKIVVLDFWTFCCINCLHVLEELREIEARYATGDDAVLVVVGVHSPKFEHEADPAALAAAVERYGVHHPVLGDPGLATWRQYAVKAWPTLAVIDPEGYLVASMAGEGHGPGLARLIDELVAEHTAKGTLRRGGSPTVGSPVADTELRFPGKIAVLPAGTLLVSDTGHHRLVELEPDGATVVRRIGSGERGARDGSADEGAFADPQGLAVLPADVADRVGYDVVVADTGNGRLRGVALATGEIRTLAHRLRSPWDVAWWQGRVAVAVAGSHQLVWYDVERGGLQPLAGTGVEGRKDGPATEGWLAQPSGLAAAGDTLWIADSETSSLRYLRAGTLHTAVGEGLFDFGHRDGPAAEARFQHPLGVAVLADSSVAVLDTYNGAVRRYEPATATVSTLATGLAEPSAAAVVDGDLVVVESAAHRLTRPLAPGTGRVVRGEPKRTERPATEVGPGDLLLEVTYTPPPGQRLDDRAGPATELTVTASPPELLAAGAGTGHELTRDLVVAAEVPAGVLHVTARIAACDVAEADTEHPACHLAVQDWGVPIRVVTGPGRGRRLGLVLSGRDG